MPPDRATAPWPRHVVPAGAQGGVQLLARQLAAATGSAVLEGTLAELDRAARDRPGDEAWHVHFSDRMLETGPAESAAMLREWARHGPLTVTLHDVPQAWSTPERQRCYLDVAAAATAWAANSHHEVRLMTELGEALEVAVPPGGQAIHLPVLPAPSAPPAARSARRRSGPATLALLGWIYPDKGHREVLRAAARLRARTGREVRVTCLGAPVAGHDDLLEELRRRAGDGDVELVVSGYLPDDALAEAMRQVDVPVAGHLHVSASGSINSWIGAGRRPLVADGRYARELAALRPGTVHLFDALDPDGRALDEAVRAVLDEPALTGLAEHVDLGPGLAETAAAYRAWWATATSTAPLPPQPVLPTW